jgi:hypothetical protein
MSRFLSLFLLIAFTCTTRVNAQDYSTGIGVKFGGIQGISVKQFTTSDAAFEIVVGGRWGGVEALVLYEIHAPAFEVDGLFWYYGAGGHIGFWEGHRHSPWSRHRSSFVGIGVDGVLGMEYKIETVPITLSLDLVPAFNIGGYNGFWLDGGLGIRYVF